MQLSLALALVPLLAPLPRAPFAPAAQAAAAEPTFQQRLDRLCDDLEQRRQLLHIAGLSLAVVHRDQVVLARGFGLRDLEQELPADERTLYAVGSTSKAFTTMLCAMLVDEGKLDWNARPATWLPGFRFHDPVIDEKATLADLLSHRTGLTRTDMAWLGTEATRAELIALLARTEKLAPYRAAWQYNNAMFLVAGECSAQVAGVEWDALLARRIFEPLGMGDTTSSSDAAYADPRLSKRYDWNAAKKGFDPVEWLDVDNMAPAGGIVSNVADMAQWVRFLLRRGDWQGGRLVSEAQIERLFTDDDELKPAYGLGWMLHDDDGQEWRDSEGGKHRVIEHGGNVPGYAACVGMLPDRDCGLVLLTNTSATQLQAGILPLVFDALFGPWKERRAPPQGEPLAPEALAKLAGAYTPGMEGRPNNALTVADGRLVLVIPPGLGQWSVTTYTLGWPDAQRRWWLLEEPDAWVEFDTDPGGHALGLTFHHGYVVRRMQPVVAREKPGEVDLTLDEFLAKRAEAAGSAVAEGVRTLRLQGRLKLPQSGIDGRYELFARGTDDLRIEFDASPYGRTTLILAGGRGTYRAHVGAQPVVEGDDLALLRFANPLVLAGHWLDHADDVELVKTAWTSDAGLPLGAACYVARVTAAPERVMTLYVRKDNFDLAAIEAPNAFPGFSIALPLAKVDATREVAGMRLPFAQSLESPAFGKLSLAFESVEVDVELDDALFELPPAAAERGSDG